MNTIEKQEGVIVASPLTTRKVRKTFAVITAITVLAAGFSPMLAGGVVGVNGTNHGLSGNAEVGHVAADQVTDNEAAKVGAAGSGSYVGSKAGQVGGTYAGVYAGAKYGTYTGAMAGGVIGAGVGAAVGAGAGAV